MTDALPKVLRRDGYATQPWKNGAGTTRLVAASPPSAGYSDLLDWQISLPTIASDGPFSPLAGFDRQWLMLEGPGVELECRTTPDAAPFINRVERPLEAFAFSGDWQVYAKLLGRPVLAFSVLSRRGRIAATLATRIIDQTTSIEKPSGETMAIFVASGSVRILSGGAATTPALERHDAALIDATGYVACSLSGGGWAASASVIIVRFARV